MIDFSVGIWYSLCNLLCETFFGTSVVAEIPKMGYLMCQGLTTIICIAVVMLPFLVAWRVLRIFL